MCTDDKGRLHIFHKWGKWEEREESWKSIDLCTGGSSAYIKRTQIRECLNCGKIQREFIS